jgi:2-keto-4-pentenoate hydratase/2-oxohepta-3-ene-1,7-dioic acid hydratase in catechol pathway
MRLVSYESEGSWRCGIAVDSAIVDLEAVVTRAESGASRPNRDDPTTRAVLALGSERLRDLDRVVREEWDELDAAIMERDQLHLGPPVWDPPKVICLGLNYRDHAAEAGLDAPCSPVFFAKWANSLIGPHDAIQPPNAAQQVDYEGELAVVIGTPGRDISSTDALSHVAGAMVFNDVSARDLQAASPTWMTGKAIDTFAPCGPELVLVDEITDLQALSIRTRVNGETVQNGTTASMIFSIADAIAYLSQIMTFETGDILTTGTPAGVGFSRNPPRFLKPGDVVEVEIGGIGTLRNPVAERSYA